MATNQAPQVPNQIIAKAGIGGAGVVVGVVGASAATVSAATLIVATGGAAALALVGYGIYKHFSKDVHPKKLEEKSPH